MLDNGTFWEISSTNLLSDTTSFTSLDISSSKFIKNKSFSGIDVTKNTKNRASQFESHLFLLLASENLFFASILFSFTLFKKLSS
jgi:hypothetical protein